MSRFSISNVSEVFGYNTPPFGEDVVASQDADDYDLEDPEQFSSVLGELRRDIEDFVSSEDEESRQAVKRVNELFASNDAEAMQDDPRLSGVDAQSILHWLAGATERDFVNFCDWNVRRHTQLQTRLHEDHDALAAEVEDGVAFLRDIGYIPLHGAQGYADALRLHPKVTAMDSFQGGLLKANGYYSGSRIAIGNLYDNKKDFDASSQTVSAALVKTSFHEYTHASDPDARFSRGLISKDDVRARLLEESYVEHVTQVVLAGDRADYALMDPEGRSQEIAASYIGERSIVSYVLGHDEVYIPPELLPESFYSPFGSSQRKKLVHALNKNTASLLPELGEYAFQTLCAEYNGVWGTSTKTLFLERVISKLLARATGQTIELFAEDNEPIPHLGGYAVMGAAAAYL